MQIGRPSHACSVSERLDSGLLFSQTANNSTYFTVYRALCPKLVRYSGAYNFDTCRSFL